MRRLGAAQFETFIAGNEAAGLVHLGRLEAAEALARELPEEHRVVLGVPGIVSAGTTLLEVALRRGLSDDARQIREEILPLARGLGGAEFLGGTLEIVARLEQSMGNLASPRQAIEEAVGICSRDAGQGALAARSAGSCSVASSDRGRRTPRPRSSQRGHADSTGPTCRGRGPRAAGRGRVAPRRRSLPLDADALRGSQCRLDALELGRASELVEALG